MYIMPDGRYFNAGPFPYADPPYYSKLYAPNLLTWEPYGIVPSQAHALPPSYPSSVMFITRDALWNPKAYVARSGGIDSMTDNTKHATDKAQILELAGASPTWQIIDSMEQSRCNHLLIVLPNRTLLAINGNENGKYNDYQTVPYRKPEIYAWSGENPLIGSWTSYAEPSNPDHKIIRGYHSSAWLMPDGRIGIGGGETLDTNDPNRRKVQFWKPPYLDSALDPRPVITNFTSSLRYGTTSVLFHSIDESRVVKRVSLIAMPSVTHAFSQNNRYVDLKFALIQGPPQGEGMQNQKITVHAPENANWAPPGYYMLFVEDTAGAISVAKIVKITDGFSRGLPFEIDNNGSGDLAGPLKVRSGDNNWVEITKTLGATATLVARATVPNPIPVKIRLRIEHNAQASNVNYRVLLKNHSTGLYVEVVASGPAPSIDTLAVHEVTGSASYVSSGTGVVEAKVEYTGSPATTIRVDEVQIGTR